MSVVSGTPRSRGPPPPPSTNVWTVPRPAASAARSGSAMIRCTWPSSASRAVSPSGRSSTDTAPSRLSATTSASAARAGAHQHPDMLSLPHADRDQAADDVVDPLPDLAGAVGAVLEQKEDIVGRAARAFLDQQPERDPRARLDLLQPGQARQLAGRLARRARACCVPCAARSRPSSARSRCRRRPPAPGRSRPGCAPPAPARGRIRHRNSVRSSGSSPSPARPRRPCRDRRPGDRFEVEPTTRPKCPAVQRELVDLGARRSLADRPYAGGGRDLVDGPDDGQDRESRCRPG